MVQPQKQLRKLKITDDEVIILFAEVLAGSPLEAEDLEDESESPAMANEFQVKSKFKPHSDLTDSMKKLRKFALEICEIGIDSKELPNWNVTGLKIDGDLLMKQSRTVLTLSKNVKRTKKVISFNTPQTTMYGERNWNFKKPYILPTNPLLSY